MKVDHKTVAAVRSHAAEMAVTPSRSHRICHAAIHAALSEKELERQYHTIERLRDHPQLRRFIAWVSGKPPEFWAPTRRRR